MEKKCLPNIHVDIMKKKSVVFIIVYIYRNHAVLIIKITRLNRLKCGNKKKERSQCLYLACCRSQNESYSHLASAILLYEMKL